MVTPFGDDGALDLGVAAQLARWLADHGSDGLVVAGTTGEGSTLTDDEKLDLWRAVAEAVTVPVIVNTGSNDTAHSVHLTRQAADLGAAGVLAVTPYYNRPSQTGIEAHFRAVAAATDLPVLLYDIPVRSGRKIAHEVMVRLAHGVANMAGVKDAAADVPATARLLASVPGSFEVYSGNDDHTLALLALGAVGVVGVATHWVGLEMAEMVAAAAKGDLAHAREINGRLLDSYLFETGDAAPNPIPAKAMMRTLGLAVGECRLPMGPAPAGLENRAREVYAALHGEKPQ
jgi:4-hydroxy-tetrahydrodipicolinate synthase